MAERVAELLNSYVQTMLKLTNVSAGQRFA